MELPIKLDNYCLPETHDEQEHSCIFRSKDGNLFCLDVSITLHKPDVLQLFSKIFHLFFVNKPFLQCAIQSATDRDQLEIDRLWLMSSVSHICKELTEPQDLSALSNRVLVPLIDGGYGS